LVHYCCANSWRSEKKSRAPRCRGPTASSRRKLSKAPANVGREVALARNSASRRFLQSALVSQGGVGGGRQGLQSPGASLWVNCVNVGEKVVIRQIPQLGKQLPLVHHATQCLWPASSAGGRSLRIMFRVPLGRSVMPANSASLAGLTICVTAVRESVVRVNTPVRVDACVAVVDALPAKGILHIGRRCNCGKG
jgi:hypothetical protein